MGGDPAIVTVTLTEVDATSTRLELDSVVPADALPPGMWETYGPGATGIGFELGLLGLGAAHRPATHRSPPRRRPHGRCRTRAKASLAPPADAWARAQVAAGESDEKAQAAADATYAFYTGA